MFLKMATAGFAISAVLLPAAAHADSSKCNGLSGYYGANTAIIVSEDGKTVNVVVANGSRPNAYGTCNGNKLTVKFPDDSTISGTHDGKSISWNNGTTWTKSK